MSDSLLTGPGEALDVNAAGERLLTGSDEDAFAARISALLPPWFADSNPALNVVLHAAANALVFVYSLLAYVQLQLRLATASDDWLDLFAADFFGTGLLRNPSESDDNFRARISANLFSPRGTRAAVSAAVAAVIGHPPQIIELTRIADTMAYGPGFGYGHGRYGGRLRHHQAIVITGGYAGNPEDVYNAINASKPFGTIVWVDLDDGVAASSYTFDPYRIA